MKRVLSCLFVGAVVFSVASTGCSEDETFPARVIMQANMAQGTHGKDCPISGSDPRWLYIGGFGGGDAPARPVEDGAEEPGAGPVSVTCSVAEAGEGKFEVSAIAGITRGDQSATVTISGTFDAEGEQKNIRGLFQSAELGRFDQSDCTVTFDADKKQGVAAGRIWGVITCPNAKDKGSDTKVCAGDAEFRFENCGQ